LSDLQPTSTASWKHYTLFHKATRSPATAIPRPTPAPRVRTGAAPVLAVVDVDAVREALLVTPVVEAVPFPADDIADPEEQDGAVPNL
jgi:hypothetical protein